MTTRRNILKAAAAAICGAAVPSLALEPIPTYTIKPTPPAVARTCIWLDVGESIETLIVRKADDKLFIVEPDGTHVELIEVSPVSRPFIPTCFDYEN